MSMRHYLEKLVVPMMVLFAACGSTLDRFVFSLIPHPQEPKIRPYEVVEVELVNSKDGTRIAGELTYPPKGDRFPGVVLVSGHEAGSPPYTRDAEITGHRYFLIISHLLTMRGYAVLRYDNRGVGASSGDYTTASDDEFASDAAAALKWLRSSSGVRLSGSGFLGHSQGGIKALMAADQAKPDYVVALAGVGVETVAETVLRQNAEINNAKAVDPSVTDQKIRELTDIFKIIRESRNREAVHASLRQYAVDSGVTDEDHIRRLIDEFGSVWWYTEALRDPKPLLEDYDGPVLALFGSKDLLVSAQVNESPTRELLRHPASQAHTFEGLNHLFQVAKKGIGPEEYWESETTIEEIVIEEIDTWVKSVRDNAPRGTGR